MIRRLAWLLGAVAVVLSGAAGAEVLLPKRNPFQFAPTPVSKPQHAPTARKAKQVIAPRFALRATLAAGAQSVANIDGQMVTIGQSIEGFVLQSVTVGSATFTKDGRTFVIELAKP